MKRYRTSRARILCIFIAALIFLAGCGGSSSAESSAASKSGASGSGGYKAPEFRDASLNEDSAEGNSEAVVDLSNSDKGYFGVRCSTDSRIKLQVFKDDETYTYDVPPDKDQIFPFSLGNGKYTIKVMKNIQDNKYAELYATSADVSLSSEFEPFLRPGQYAAYSKSSKCVAKAAELASGAEDANGFITNVYDYVCKNITYDREKAANIQPGYIPDPDEIMELGKGICFDYASLAASMLRSQGIPTKIIFGYVGDSGDLYHAWNMFYTEESGWVAVKFEVSGEDWNRMDLTFSANGSDSSYIGDGSNYLDVYQY